MNNLTISDIDCHMVDALTATIEEQISRLCFRMH